MNNKLFLVCPFSCMENFIREKFGNDVFFMTAMAAISHYDGEEILVMKKFLVRENINEIIIASDTSCRFINSALKSEKEFGSYAEKKIQEIILEHRDALTKANNEVEKQKIIAKAIIKNQAQELCSPNLFLLEIFKIKITVKGIITTKSNNEIRELNFKKN